MRGGAGWFIHRAPAHEAYRAIDLEALASRVRRRVLVDGRRVIDLVRARRAGFQIRAIGLPHGPR